MGVLNNGMSLLGVDSNWQYVIKGLVLLFAVVFSCSMWANAQRVTWATEAGLSAIQRTGYGECWRPSTRLGISADYNVNNVFSMKSGLYYTFRGYSVNNGGTYSNGDATWIENVSQTRHFLQVPILAKFSIHSNNSTKFFFEIGPYIGCLLYTSPSPRD